MKEELENHNAASDEGSVATQSAGKKEDHADETVTDETSLSMEEIRQLKEKADKADVYWARLLREAADFENYKKRAARERQDAIKYANESLFQKLIPIIDNFDMALSATATSDAASGDAIKKGVQMIHAQLKATLAEAGLEEIDATNAMFDPNFHEAVSQKETTDVPEGRVVQQIRKGYKFRDRLVRPATVVVAKKP